MIIMLVMEIDPTIAEKEITAEQAALILHITRQAIYKRMKDGWKPTIGNLQQELEAERRKLLEKTSALQTVIGMLTEHELPFTTPAQGKVFNLEDNAQTYNE